MSDFKIKSGLTWVSPDDIKTKSESVLYRLNTKFIASDPANGDYFGNAVALSSDGNIAIVGAVQEDTSPNTNNGAAYVFTRSGTTWTQQQKLLASDAASSDAFGYSVDLSSDGYTAIVGAYTEDTSPNTDNGAAYVFTRSGTTWTQQAKLVASDPAAYDSFGRSVALSSDGNIAIVGAVQEDTSPDTDNGAAYIFTRSISTWTQQQKLQSSSPYLNGYFGYSVDLSSDGDTAIVGAVGEDVDPGPSSLTAGAAYVFTRKTFGTGSNNLVRAIAIQSDGKIVIGGYFQTFNGAFVNRIIRLNSDGTHDTTFNTNIGTGAILPVETIAIQSDGKIILGGNFYAFNGLNANYIIRLNSDGTRDTAFMVGDSNVGPNDIVSTIAIQSSGKIVLGGYFTTFSEATVATVNYIVRLNSDGTRDTAFTTGTGASFNNRVSTAGIQSDQKIVLGGYFTIFNGTTVNRIVRLNSGDGSRDAAFTTNTGTGANSVVNTVAIQQSDSKIVLGGDFTTFNGTTVNRIVRLNVDGTRDTTFTTNTGTGFNGTVNTIAIQSDGKIVVGGNFTTFNGATVNYMVRLNSNGTRDTTFTTNTGAGVNNTVYATAIQSDGKIILGGSFPGFDGITVNSIVRINSDGTVWAQQQKLLASDPTAPDYFGSAVALSSDGSTAIVGAYTEDTSPNTSNGAAYVFTRSGTTWTQQQKLLASDAASNDTFGASVDLSYDGNIALIGGFSTVYSAAGPGGAYLFTRSGTTWTQQQKLLASDAINSDYFGNAVALSLDGNTAIVGAYSEDTSPNTDNGAAYIFEPNDWARVNVVSVNNGGTWSVGYSLPPGAPTLTVSNVGSMYTLAWNRPLSYFDITGYSLQIASSPFSEASWSILGDPGLSRSWTFYQASGLSITNYYRVAAKTQYVTGPYSNSLPVFIA